MMRWGPDGLMGRVDGMFSVLAQGVETIDVEQRVEFARWSSGNALFVGAVAALVGLYAVVWLYRREGRGRVGGTLRWALVVCRCLVLALLGVVGLEPVVVDYVHHRIDAYTLVLADASASMSLGDRYRTEAGARRVENVIGEIPTEGVVRADLATRVLNDAGRRLLTTLAVKNNVKVFTFGDGLTFAGLIEMTDGERGGGAERGRRDGASEAPLVDQDGGGSAGSGGPTAETAVPQSSSRGGEVADCIEIVPRGPATDLGVAVRGALDSAGGAPVAGVVLLTDGGFNQGESPAVVGAMLKRLGVPLYAVGVGDPSEPVNLRIVEASAPRSVFKNDPFSVVVRIAASGIEDRTARIELLERRSGEGETNRVVANQTAVIRGGGRSARIVFTREVSEPGAVTYTARIVPQPDEAVTSDNQREIIPALRVLDDKMRVLVVAGAPSYEYRFLSRMLERDSTVDLSTWLQSADFGAVRDGNTVITELPATPDALFAYDGVILLDCDPETFEPGWGELVAEFVSGQGGGVLYAAGNKYAGSFFRSPRSKALVDVLPIVAEPDAEIMLNDLGHYQTKAWPPVIPPEAASNPIVCQAEQPLDNRAVWAGLEGVYWHYPVRREKPVARVLLRHSNPRVGNSFGRAVLLATQFVGTGRSAYLGFDSTWRWRTGDEQAFDRFWIRTLRYLVEGKQLGGRARALILTSKEQFELGESVVLTVRALDEGFEPLLVPELEMTASCVGERPGAESVSRDEYGGVGIDRGNDVVALAPMPGREGYYEGRFVPRSAGTFRFSVVLPGGAALNGGVRAAKEIVVAQSDVEMRDTAMDRAGLVRLAEQTGGRYFEVDEAGKAAEMIRERSRMPPPVRGLPRALWDRWYVLVLLVGLLTVEWILRKKARLL